MAVVRSLYTSQLSALRGQAGKPADGAIPDTIARRTQPDMPSPTARGVEERENAFNGVNLLHGYAQVRILSPTSLIYGHEKEV